MLSRKLTKNSDTFEIPREIGPIILRCGPANRILRAVEKLRRKYRSPQPIAREPRSEMDWENPSR